MGTATALLDWARSQIGVTEDPPGSNKVRYWDDVGRHDFQGEPWCAAFCLAGLVATGTAPVTRSVWVPGIVLNYKHAGRLFPVADARPGDQALFRIGKGHTGVVESIDATTRSVTCIEGNTSSDNHGSQDNGGGVFRRTRHWSVVVGVGRPVFSGSAPPAITPFPGDRMHRIDLTNITLDDKGNGWVPVPNTAADKVVSVVAQGSFPPVDGYWNLPVFGRQQRGSDTIIQISEADPRAVEQVSVWVADS